MGHLFKWMNVRGEYADTEAPTKPYNEKVRQRVGAWCLIWRMLRWLRFSPDDL